MIVALVNGQRTFATPGATGTCPTCVEQLRSKCGTLVRHHWAHHPQAECASTTTPETDWHVSWKFDCADPARVEVTKGAHRADAMSPSGLILEFQHSNIDPEDVRARERHWRKGVWVWDGTEAASSEYRLEIRTHPDRLDDTYRTFIWRWAPHIVRTARWPIWVDIDNDRLLLVGRIHFGRSPTSGYGWVVPRATFIEGILNGWGLDPDKPSFGCAWEPKPIGAPFHWPTPTEIMQSRLSQGLFADGVA